MTDDQVEPSESAESGSSERHLRGTRLGIVARCETRDRGFVFLRDEAGEEYFAHRRGFLVQAEFDGIDRGTAVTFRVTRAAKGLRAHHVERASEAQQTTVAGWAETMGNR